MIDNSECNFFEGGESINNLLKIPTRHTSICTRFLKGLLNITKETLYYYELVVGTYIQMNNI